MSELVTASNLSVSFGSTVALRNINLSIKKGEAVAVIGLNGAGKTTLLQVILGITKPTGGSISVLTRRIGYVPQRLSFDRSMPLTVRELMTAYGAREEAIEESLERTGSIALIGRKVGELSGGQLQRVLLANALSSDPELLLLDEPTAGVDIVGERSFFDIIKGLQDLRNLAIILVSHDIHMVYRYATKVICLNRTIICQGAPKVVAESSDAQALFGKDWVTYEHDHD